MAAVNYFVDVNGVYHTSAYRIFVSDYVQRLVASPHGLRAVTFERAVKLEMARQVPADCYVTGSSHEMMVAIDRMPALGYYCKSLVNLGVSGGSYQDVVTQLALVARRAPAAVFIGVGPWFFKATADYRWTEFSEEYYRGREVFGLAPIRRPLPTEKLSNLVNADYFERNIEDLLTRKELSLPPIPTIVEASADGTNLADEDPIYRPDGSYIYSRRFYRDVTARDVPACTDYKIGLPYVEQSVIDEFATVVRRARDMGVEIRFLLMPYHPGVEKCSNLTAPALPVVEQTVRHLAGQLGVTVIGSYSARKFGLEPQDFYDAAHIDGSALSRITREPDAR